MTQIRFDHVALGLRRIVDAQPFLEGELGGRVYGGGPAGEFVWVQWAFDGGGRIEILEPLGEAGFMHRFLERSGPGPHHVTFYVPSLAATCDHAAELGYDVVGRDERGAGWKEAFLHPRQALGIVVQCVERIGDDDDEAEDGGGVNPALPAPLPDPADPVHLIGPTLVAHSEARARRQWQELLGADCEAASAERLVFRWPDSPLRLAVDLDPNAREGLCSVDLATRSGLALPEGPVPGFGTVFRAL